MRATSNAQKMARGTMRPCLHKAEVFADDVAPDPDVIPPLEGMTAAAVVIWEAKIAKYRARGQRVGGCEDALRHYCELEALLNAGWSTGKVNVHALNQYRILASEFFDTPASQMVSLNRASKKENKFSKNGRRSAA